MLIDALRARGADVDVLALYGRSPSRSTTRRARRCSAPTTRCSPRPRRCAVLRAAGGRGAARRAAPGARSARRRAPTLRAHGPNPTSRPTRTRPTGSSPRCSPPIAGMTLGVRPANTCATVGSTSDRAREPRCGPVPRTARSSPPRARPRAADARADVAAPPGSALLMSLVLREPRRAAAAARRRRGRATAVGDARWLKWPNDVLVRRAQGRGHPRRGRARARAGRSSASASTSRSRSPTCPASCTTAPGRWACTPSASRAVPRHAARRARRRAGSAREARARRRLAPATRSGRRDRWGDGRHGRAGGIDADGRLLVTPADGERDSSTRAAVHLRARRRTGWRSGRRLRGRLGAGVVVVGIGGRPCAGGAERGFTSARSRAFAAVGAVSQRDRRRPCAGAGAPASSSRCSGGAAGADVAAIALRPRADRTDRLLGGRVGA